MKKRLIALFMGCVIMVQAGAENAAYLGVATRPVDPALGAQLSLARGIGLVVTEIDEEGPAGALLKKNDVLHLLDGQKLVNHAQLSVLVSAQKPGDEIKLGVFRGGKAVDVSAVLVERPASLGAPSFPDDRFAFPQAGDDAMRRLQEALEEMRALQGNMHSFRFNPPAGGAGGLQVIPPNGASGGTAPQVQHSFSSASKVMVSKDGYQVTVESKNGQKTARVVDENDAVVFEGPINTQKELDQVPAKARKIIEGISMHSTGPGGPVL